MSTSSMARWRPKVRHARGKAPMRAAVPRVTSGRRKIALGDARTRSLFSAISKPTP